jgi:hypothetical protein
MFGKCYNVRVPMLHGCAFRGCQTLTLSTYCYEHELSSRAEIEAERAPLATRNEPTTRELAETQPRAAA